MRKEGSKTNGPERQWYQFFSPPSSPAVYNEDVVAGSIWAGFKERTTAHGVPHVHNAKGNENLRVKKTTAIHFCQLMSYYVLYYLRNVIKRNFRKITCSIFIWHTYIPILDCLAMMPYKRSIQRNTKLGGGCFFISYWAATWLSPGTSEPYAHGSAVVQENKQADAGCNVLHLERASDIWVGRMAPSIWRLHMNFCRKWYIECWVWSPWW